MWKPLDSDKTKFTISATIDTTLIQTPSVWTAMGLSDDNTMVSSRANLSSVSTENERVHSSNLERQ